MSNRAKYCKVNRHEVEFNFRATSKKKKKPFPNRSIKCWQAYHSITTENMISYLLWSIFFEPILKQDLSNILFKCNKTIYTWEKSSFEMFHFFHIFYLSSFFQWVNRNSRLYCMAYSEPDNKQHKYDWLSRDGNNQTAIIVQSLLL